MRTRKFDHAAFLEEEKYIWADTGNTVLAKLTVFVSLAVISGVIFAGMV